MDKSQELALLTRRPTRERRPGLVIRSAGFEPTQGRANGPGGGLHRGLHLHRGFGHEGLVLLRGVQLSARILQQRHHFGEVARLAGFRASQVGGSLLINGMEM